MDRPVCPALESRFGDCRPRQQVANDFDVAWFPVVRGRHDGEMFGAEIEATGDPRPETADGLEGFGAGAEIRQVVGIAEARPDPAIRSDDGQVPVMDCLRHAAPLDTHQWSGGVGHSPEYKEGDGGSFGRTVN